IRKDDWAVLLDDMEHGGWLVPIFALAHEHDLDPGMRPYKDAIGAEKREELIVGMAAGVMGIYRHFEAQRLLGTEPPLNAATYRKLNRLSTLPPFVAQRLRLVATILVPADQVRNSNNAVVRPPYCIRFARELRGYCHVLLRNTGPN